MRCYTNIYGYNFHTVKKRRISGYNWNMRTKK